MRVALIENYAPDRQQSMLRFGQLLAVELERRGHSVRRMAPRLSPALDRLRRAARWPADHKWLGYVEKYLRFRAHLRTAPLNRREIDVVHVVDHSNALYVPTRAAVPWVVTCHDLLAVRGALGEATDCPATRLGQQLQRSIQRGLGRAAAVVTDSTSTKSDLDRIVPDTREQLRRTILLALNHPYSPVPRAAALARLEPFKSVPWSQPFLLHVGSNLTRKNKSGVWRIFASIAAEWPGRLVFVGAPLPVDVQAAATAQGLAHRVHAAEGLSNAQLEAAYSLAHGLVFPSTCEGFGWPIIEAQACGCPVICSDRTSLPEVAGDGAAIFDLHDEAGMAMAIVGLTDPTRRQELTRLGTQNLARFTPTKMMDAYESLYRDVVAGATRR